ncbi:MAG: hypothetical protein GWO81_00870 [Verrucomicrobia bacterium]|nr:hypothetical protein [Verrucomicrobiota bacterium]
MNVVRGIVFGLVLALAVLPYLLMKRNAMPRGGNLASPFCHYQEARLLIDQTYAKSADGGATASQEIFDTILAEIEAAETYLILDFFLWNNWRGKLGSDQALRPLARELFEALKNKRRKNPNLPILVITDPINRFYASGDTELEARWKQAGLSVVFTDLSQLPDSNRVYAPLAQFWGRLLAPLKIGGWVLPLKNPLEASAPRFSLSQWNRLFHFKANHRKVLISGRSDGEARLIVTSFNPADGSARHSNAGLLVTGPIARYAARSEIAIARSSGRNPDNVLGASPEEWDRLLLALESRLPELAFHELAEAGETGVAWRSEGAIGESLLGALDSAGVGDRIDIALFYLSDRNILAGLREAAERGALIRCLLDANKDAFGRKKNGIPNRVVAAELLSDSEAGRISIRWADTRNEQFHSKVLRVRGLQTDLLCLGSANWTRRNLGNLNLEANLLMRECGALGQEWDAYYEALWTNAHSAEASLPYSAQALSGWSLRWKTVLYRFQEWSGLSTF